MFVLNHKGEIYRRLSPRLDPRNKIKKQVKDNPNSLVSRATRYSLKLITRANAVSTTVESDSPVPWKYSK